MVKSNDKIIIILALFIFISLPLFSEEKSDIPIPDVPSFTLTYNKELLSCSPVRLIKKKTHKNLVEYRCKGPDASQATKKKRTEQEERGRSETERVRQDIETKRDEGVSYIVKINHSDAMRPYVAAVAAKRQLENKFYGKILTWLLPARFYVTIRPQFTTKGTDSKLEYRNGGTRGGFYYYYEFDNQVELMTQYEANIRNNDGEAFIDFSDISNSSRRLSYLSLSYDDYTVLFGKYWSAYYDIADFTDYFMTFGKQGSGAYNNGGDGSESGTGRVDNMLQVHMKKFDFSVTAQYQFAHDGPDNLDTPYRYTTAASLLYRGFENISMGAAFDYAAFDEITPLMKGLGIHGNEENYIAGVTYEKEQYGLNVILDYSKNHMNDDQGIYFDAMGAELYLHYDFTKNIRLAGGGNWMIPKDDDYEGRYSIKKGILSLQYTFGEATFDDLVYLEVAFPKGHLADGELRKTTVAIGLRYLFDLH
jgi:hypothetical protein